MLYSRSAEYLEIYMLFRKILLTNSQREKFIEHAEQVEKGIDTFERSVNRVLNKEFLQIDRQSFKIIRLADIERIITMPICEATAVPSRYYAQNNIKYSYFSPTVEKMLTTFVLAESDEEVRKFADYILRLGCAQVGKGPAPCRKEAEKYYGVSSGTRGIVTKARDTENEIFEKWRDSLNSRTQVKQPFVFNY